MLFSTAETQRRLKDQLKVLILNAAEVRELLPMAECIRLISGALSSLQKGEVFQPLRTIIRPPAAKGLLGLMSAYRGGRQPALGLKAITVFPENPAHGLDAHQGAVLLFSVDTGELSALINASAITALRTAAVSAVATDLLARRDANELTIIGAGVQARTHLRAIAAIRSLRRARIVSRDPAHSRQCADELQREVSFAVEPVANVQEALKGADIVVTATSSREPVLDYTWLEPGVHINAIGTHSPASREIDSATMSHARLFVDSRESALNEAGDYLLAAAEGVVTADSILAELGELLVEAKPGRTTDTEITLFKSLGLAIEDIVCADYLFRTALDNKAGSWFEY
jgi:ornithine cyclodeaminase/alanine dehydrogenase-like protein (mu-crystallin family)